MPIRAMCTGGRVVTMRPLPSLVTQAQRPGLGHAKIYPRDADVRLQEGLAQHPAGRAVSGGDILGVGHRPASRGRSGPHPAGAGARQG